MQSSEDLPAARNVEELFEGRRGSKICRETNTNAQTPTLRKCLVRDSDVYRCGYAACSERRGASKLEDRNKRKKAIAAFYIPQS